MKDAWIPVIGAAAVATISLVGAVYLRSAKKVDAIGGRWNQIAALFVAAVVAISASHYGHLDWYFAIPLGVLAFGIVRIPAFARYNKNNKKAIKDRAEISN
jgi:hypothetical protein